MWISVTCGDPMNNKKAMMELAKVECQTLDGKDLRLTQSTTFSQLPVAIFISIGANQPLGGFSKKLER